jgi:hypothetical protein
MSLSDRLTPRQLDIARCIARGLTLAETAAELGLSLWTVRQRCHDGDDCLYRRLGARNAVDVARAVYLEEGMGEQPTESKPAERDWTVREGVIHYIPDTIPAGEVGYTDYRNDDCQLRRWKWDDRAKPVRAPSETPLLPGMRAIVRSVNGEYVAERER